MELSEHDQNVLNVIFDPLQLNPNNYDLDDLKEENEDIHDKIENDQVAELVKHAVAVAESGRLQQALDLFDQVLKKAPRLPSILNDRAQVLRLAGKTQDALEDLNQAIEITKGKGKVGTKALCQRGLINRLNGREDEAKIDFELAAKNGSKFARSQIVNLNPYAAMCNAMLKQMTTNSKDNVN